MELLVVISIIMILMGLSFVGVRMAKEAAAKSKTNAIIHQVAAALEQYRLVNGKYPEGGDFATYLGSNPKFDGVSDWTSIGNILVDSLNTAGQSFKKPLVDGWKHPLRYRPARYLPYDATAAVDIDKDDPPGRDSFQLWSMGPNNQDQGGTADSDDLTSWPKK
jgi:type II secretory pathway pseudopilin PulG